MYLRLSSERRGSNNKDIRKGNLKNWEQHGKGIRISQGEERQKEQMGTILGPYKPLPEVPKRQTPTQPRTQHDSALVF